MGFRPVGADGPQFVLKQGEGDIFCFDTLANDVLEHGILLPPEVDSDTSGFGSKNAYRVSVIAWCSRQAYLDAIAEKEVVASVASF